MLLLLIRATLGVSLEMNRSPDNSVFHLLMEENDDRVVFALLPLTILLSSVLKPFFSSLGRSAMFEGARQAR